MKRMDDTDTKQLTYCDGCKQRMSDTQFIRSTKNLDLCWSCWEEIYEMVVQEMKNHIARQAM